jgi:hypothetical protein
LYEDNSPYLPLVLDKQGTYTAGTLLMNRGKKKKKHAHNQKICETEKVNGLLHSKEGKQQHVSIIKLS